MKIHFDSFFNIDKNLLDSYGAFNISLINDLPLFIDPFLLFSSNKEEYQTLHKSIIEYLTFLKEKSNQGINSEGKIKAWYIFSEVKQNWLGYSKIGNSGRGLNINFGKNFSASLNHIFDDLGNEKITQSSHIEKAALFETGVGRDNISDFTTNLIKQYLCNYTEKFALENIENKYLKKVQVEKAYFDYKFEKWMSKEFTLPYIPNNYVLLTPKDILTKDESWINRQDFRSSFSGIINSISNEQLRFEISNYFNKCLPKHESKKTNKPNTKEIEKAISETLKKYPEIAKYYIKTKEENKTSAKNISAEKVNETYEMFVLQLNEFVSKLERDTNFYKIESNSSYEEAMLRINFLKEVIENNDGYKLFYANHHPIKREADLQIIYRLTWYASDYDVNREVNNGRGPVDYTVSNGANDKTLVEFKLASNSKLKQNLQNQVEVYESANNTKNSIKVILYFDTNEFNKVQKILEELKLDKSKNIILIDASIKTSASNVKLDKIDKQ